MTNPKSIALFTLALFVASCGSSSNSGGRKASFAGIAVPGSAMAGAILLNREIDNNYPGSLIYFYNFSDGNVTELSTLDTRDPLAISGSKGVWIFNRSATPPTVQYLASTSISSSSDSNLGPVIPLEGLGLGDPWDAAEIVSADGVTWLALAAPAAGNVVLFNTANPALSYTLAGTWDLPSGITPRPTGLGVSGKKMYVLHQGLTPSASTASANGSQRVFAIDVTDPSAAAMLGKTSTISASTAQRFTNAKWSKPVTLGFCSRELGSQCQSGIDQIDLQTGGATSGNPLTGDYSFFNQVFDGDTAATAYAQVVKGAGSADEAIMTVRVDTSSGTITDITTHPDDRLLGGFVDTSTSTFFMGNHNADAGIISLYKNGVSTSNFALPTVLYSAALLPK